MSLSPELISQIITWAEAPDEAAIRSQLEAALGDFQPVPERRWTEFPVRSVLAVILWHAGQYQKAVDLAVRAMAQTGRDAAAIAVIEASRAVFYSSAMQALHHKRPDMARPFVEASLRLCRPFLDVRAEQSLLDLMDFVAASAAGSPPPVAPQGRPTVLNLCVWGERFIAAAERTFLPCCLAPGNIPELAAHGTVYLRIHTRAEDVACISNLPVVRALAAHACIDARPIPPQLLQGTHLGGKQGWNRLLIAALSYADLMFAQRIGADLLYGGADVLVAGRTYSTVKRRLLSGYRAVVMQPIRAIAIETERLLEARRCRRPDGSFDIPGDVLYWASLKAIHPFILRSFMRRVPTTLPVDPVQFYFSTPEGFALHAYQLSILGLAGEHVPADIGCDYHTTDARLLSDLLVGCDRDSACYMERRMPSDIYVVGLDEAGEMASFGAFELSPAGSVRSIQKWIGREEDIGHFLWAVRQKIEYPLPPDVVLDMPTDCPTEDGTIAEITRLLEGCRPAILGNLAHYRR